MEDYERVNAREWDLGYKEPAKQPASQEDWQVVTRSKKRAEQPAKHQPSPRKWHSSGPSKRIDQAKRLPPKLLLEPDNEAEAAWRARAKATDEVRIPEDLVLQSNYHKEVAKEHGCFVFSPHAHGSGGSKTFGIWGEAKAVALTKRTIARWIEASKGGRKLDPKLKFPKVVSLTPKLREKEEKRWSREVTRQRFRQCPPPDMAFQAIGSFHWPAQEYSPEGILGANYEALDPLRMDCACYVVFSKERKIFRIMGKATDVQTGLQRLRKTCFQIAARQVIPVRMYLLRWLAGADVPAYIYWRYPSRPAILSPEDAVTEKPGRSPTGEDAPPYEARSRYAGVQTGLNVERLRSALFKTFRKLHYYRGSLQMRIRLGTFLATQYIDPGGDGQYELEDFESMIMQSQFEGSVTQEIGDKPTEDAVLPTLQMSKDFITPSDATIVELRDVKPVYCATFTFADEAGNLRLSVEWQEAQDAESMKSSFERPLMKWTRLERDVGLPTPLFDVSLVDLNTGSGWQFDILASLVVEQSRLPQQLVNFAHKLQFDPAIAKKQSPDHLFVRYNPHANLRAIQQRISYRYRLANSDLKLELSRFQDREYSSSTSGVASGGLSTVFEPRWSLNVYGTEWDTMCSQNERLAVGEQTTWRDDVMTWFPYDVGPGSSSSTDEDEGQGWNQMMEKLERIETLVRSAKSEGE